MFSQKYPRSTVRPGHGFVAPVVCFGNVQRLAGTLGPPVLSRPVRGLDAGARAPKAAAVQVPLRHRWRPWVRPSHGRHPRPSSHDASLPGPMRRPAPRSRSTTIKLLSRMHRAWAPTRPRTWERPCSGPPRARPRRPTSTRPETEQGLHRDAPGRRGGLLSRCTPPRFRHRLASPPPPPPGADRGRPRRRAARRRRARAVEVRRAHCAWPSWHEVRLPGRGGRGAAGAGLGMGPVRPDPGRAPGSPGGGGGGRLGLGPPSPRRLGVVHGATPSRREDRAARPRRRRASSGRASRRSRPTWAP